MRPMTIAETEDYKSLVPVMMANGLEFGMDEPVPTDLVKCWKLTDDEGRVRGGAVLAVREGQYICDGICVDAPFRKEGWGRKLLTALTEETAERGGESIFLVARAPGFFAREGFFPVDKKEAPMFFECFDCPQYGNSCHPEVMRRDL